MRKPVLGDRDGDKAGDLPKRSAKNIEVTAINAICVLSDDEGSNNNADMDRFSIQARIRDFNDGKLEDRAQWIQVYHWGTASELSIYEGYDWKMGTSAELKYVDTPKKDFSKSVLEVLIHHREYDSGSANEKGYATLTLTGDEMLGTGDQQGAHTVYAGSSDAGFNVNLTVREIVPAP